MFNRAKLRKEPFFACLKSWVIRTQIAKSSFWRPSPYGITTDLSIRRHFWLVLLPASRGFKLTICVSPSYLPPSVRNSGTLSENQWNFSSWKQKIPKCLTQDPSVLFQILRNSWEVFCTVLSCSGYLENLVTWCQPRGTCCFSLSQVLRLTLSCTKLNEGEEASRIS